MGWKDDILKYHVISWNAFETKHKIDPKAFHENDATCMNNWRIFKFLTFIFNVSILFYEELYLGKCNSKDEYVLNRSSSINFNIAEWYEFKLVFCPPKIAPHVEVTDAQKIRRSLQAQVRITQGEGVGGLSTMKILFLSQ